MSVNLRALIARLNDESRRALESAAGLCLSRTHYDVEIEHYLMKALDDTDGDIAAILKHYGVDRSRLASELTRSLDKLKTGNARNPCVQPDAREGAHRGVDDRIARASGESRAHRSRDARAAFGRRARATDARRQQGAREDLSRGAARRTSSAIVAGTSEDAAAASATGVRE